MRPGCRITLTLTLSVAALVGARSQLGQAAANFDVRTEEFVEQDLWQNYKALEVTRIIHSGRTRLKGWQCPRTRGRELSAGRCQVKMGTGNDIPQMEVLFLKPLDTVSMKGNGF